MGVMDDDKATKDRTMRTTVMAPIQPKLAPTGPITMVEDDAVRFPENYRSLDVLRDTYLGKVNPPVWQVKAAIAALKHEFPQIIGVADGRRLDVGGRLDKLCAERKAVEAKFNAAVEDAKARKDFAELARLAKDGPKEFMEEQRKQAQRAKAEAIKAQNEAAAALQHPASEMAKPFQTSKLRRI
jgi:hypothetical protein